MSELRNVHLESHRDGIRELVLNRPPVNALGHVLVADITAACAVLAADREARCVVVRSGGKHFCAGADLKERQGMSEDEVRAFVPRLAGAVNALAGLPMPTIAAVRGVAAGGGCELALAADMRLLADDARIGLKETALAIVPGAGGTQRLPRLIGPALAKRWIFAAGLYDADQARADGVADRVVAAEELDDAALAFAREIAANGPVAVRLAKRAIDEGAALPLEAALALEWECYQQVLGTADREEALRAFAGKRPPKFTGR